jgi:uncharacterized FlaG/YvyC family protein
MNTKNILKITAISTIALVLVLGTYVLVTVRMDDTKSNQTTTTTTTTQNKTQETQPTEAADSDADLDAALKEIDSTINMFNPDLDFPDVDQNAVE